MNPAYARARGCLMKVGHPTLAVAEAKAAKTQQNKGVIYHAYKCPWCRLFHVGRPQGNKRESTMPRIPEKQPKDTTIVIRTCACGEKTKFVVSTKHYQQWRRNELSVKEAFPYLTQEAQLWLVFNSCPKCVDRDY